MSQVEYEVTVMMTIMIDAEDLIDVCARDNIEGRIDGCIDDCDIHQIDVEVA